MKKIIFILFFFPGFCFSQQQDTLVMYEWGLPIFSPEFFCKYDFCDQFGFTYESVAGCEVTTKEEEKWENHNKKIERLLEKRNGKNWKKRYQSEVTKCELVYLIAEKEYAKITDFDFQEGDKILSPRILFDFDGGAAVLKESYDSLKIIAGFIQKNPNLEIEISVHTDSSGAEDYNKKLSELRARSLSMALKNNFNLSPEKNNFIIKGYGESATIISAREIEKIFETSEKEKYHRINRRIEIKILKVN